MNSQIRMILMTDLTEPEKLGLGSMNIIEEQKSKLKQIFPHIFDEDKIDFDKLRQSLGEEVDQGQERYGMTWPGKSECFKIIQQPSMGTLKPSREESVNFDETENLFIEGDNLEVLKILQKSYYGKIKMIYIDPPYNTGKEFIYPDKYSETLDTYLAYTGQVNDEGIKFSTNTEKDGRFHSKWLNMMYPRLFLARNLLREDGVIFISIDDHEVSNLRKVCDEIFGEDNFVANIIWEKKYSPSNDAKWLSDNHDHILLYAKDKEIWRPILLPRTKEQLDRYKNLDGDSRGLWKSSGLDVKTYSAAYDYPITTPSGRVVSPPHGSCWRFSKEKFQEMVQDNRIWFGEDGSNVPSIKRFLSEVKDGITPLTIWKYQDVGHNQSATQEVKKLFGTSAYFDTPKPTLLLKRAIYLAAKEEDIILDFFAGSATTAHAVLDMNKENDCNCKFIMVQLPEPCNEASEAFKAGYKTIADISKERIRLALNKIKDEQRHDSSQITFSDTNSKNDIKKLDLGFKVLKLDKSNFNQWDGSIEVDTKGEKIVKQLQLAIENIDPKSSEEDILYELLLKSGFGLTTKVEKIELADQKVYSIENDSLLICLSRDISKEVITEMAKREPARVICLDDGFAGNDQLKTNAVQIMKSFGVEDFRTI